MDGYLAQCCIPFHLLRLSEWQDEFTNHDIGAPDATLLSVVALFEVVLADVARYTNHAGKCF